QGRGSAANSAVCYALEVTAVDAVRFDLMFERFLGPERTEEPPDIDIDIESDRREEVIQYVYTTHGRDRAAQVANVITYRHKSAPGAAARSFGYPPGRQDAGSRDFERGFSWPEAGAREGRWRKGPAGRDAGRAQRGSARGSRPSTASGAPAEAIPADVI